MSISCKINPAVLRLLLAPLDRIYGGHAYHAIRVAALLERLSQEADIEATLDRFDALLDGAAAEMEEIEELGRSLGLDE